MKKRNKLLCTFICAALLMGLCSCGSAVETTTENKDNETTQETTSEEMSTKEITESEEITTEAETEEVTEEAIEKVEFNASDYRTDITMDSLLRKPDDYVDMKIKIEGQVNSCFADDDYSYIQIMDDGGDDFYIAGYDPDMLDFRILTDDYVTVYGVFKGLGKYETVAGLTKEEPTLLAVQIEVETYDDMADSPAGELRTGTYTSSEVSGEITTEKVAEITYQDGEAYAITLNASIKDGPELGSAWTFLTDNGDGTYTGKVDDICTLTITAYSDHFNVSFVCTDDDLLYQYDGIQGDYYY